MISGNMFVLKAAVTSTGLAVSEALFYLVVLLCLLGCAGPGSFRCVDCVALHECS